MSQRDIEPSHLETLDRDLGRVSSLELATAYVAKPLVAPALALIFIAIVGVIAVTKIRLLFLSFNLFIYSKLSFAM